MDSAAAMCGLTPLGSLTSTMSGEDLVQAFSNSGLLLCAQVLRGNDARDAEVVLAIDIIWLKELVAPLAFCIGSILHHPLTTRQQESLCSPNGKGGGGGEDRVKGRGGCKCAILAFGLRASASSTLFLSLDEVCAAFTAHALQPVVWRRMVVERVPGEAMPIAVLHITPCNSR